MSGLLRLCDVYHTAPIPIGPVFCLACIALQASAAPADALPRPLVAAPGRPARLTAAGAGTVLLGKRSLPACRQVRVRFTLQFRGKSEGAGLIFPEGGDSGEARMQLPPDFAWQEPNLPHCFGVGFDTSDPPTRNPFDANGNIYGRPQHQVSLHWDGRERANRVAPVAFDDGMEHAVEVLLEYTPGGVLVTVRIDTEPVYDRWFVIGPVPVRSRPAFGFAARKDAPQSALAFTWTDAATARPVSEWPKPERVPVFRDVILNARNRAFIAPVSLPVTSSPVQRIILTYTLGAPPGGIDPWDRVISVAVWDREGRRIEIVRGITTFGKPCTWSADVTDYQSLLHGRCKMGVSIGTWVKGWLVNVHLDYYRGRPEWEAFRVTPLWSGDWEYGNPEDPLARHFPVRRLRLAPETRRAVVRVVVTGHGMRPNTANAAEFFPAWRTLRVNGHAFKNLLWRQDCWLNPCRPQGGTWKYDRAGWCPGALVRPWDVDVMDLIPADRTLVISYEPQKYVNQNAGKSRASHLVSVQCIEFRRPSGGAAEDRKADHLLSSPSQDDPAHPDQKRP